MKNLHKAKVYAKIKQLRQRIYVRNTGWPARHIQEEDLEFVDSQLEKMDNDETYCPYSNPLIEMNTLWVEYGGKLCHRKKAPSSNG